MSRRGKSDAPSPGHEREVELRITGGSYADLAKRLTHPHGADFEMVARGLVELLATNHFDAAVIVVHALADLMADSCLRERYGEVEPH